MLYLKCIAALAALLLVYYLLIKLDERTDYTNRKIPYQFYDGNGLHIRVPHLIWQMKKRRVIYELYSEEVTYEGKNYNVLAIFKEQTHWPLPGDALPVFFYKDFVAKVELKQSKSHQSITNKTVIYGDHNKVIINQNDLYTINNHIDQLLQYDNINDTDKQCLELFKYKLMDGNITETDKSRVLSLLLKLSQYAPYATLSAAIINLIKSLLP